MTISQKAKIAEYIRLLGVAREEYDRFKVMELIYRRLRDNALRDVLAASLRLPAWGKAAAKLSGMFPE